MGDNTPIEWTDASWTPIRASRPAPKGNRYIGWHCEHASPGCVNCYAEGINKRLGTHYPFKPGHRDDVEIFLDEKMLLQPLVWKKPRRIFVCSMTDLFADFVPDDMIDRIFAIMALCPQHTFQVLTKRAERMRKYMLGWPHGAARWHWIGGEAKKLRPDLTKPDGPPQSESWYWKLQKRWPLPNVWLGVSVEDQQRADERIPHLLQAPATVRFLSCEPLLGPINLTRIFLGEGENDPALAAENGIKHIRFNIDALAGAKSINWPGIDWVIAGGESGPGARPMHPDWARSLRDQCAAADVPFHFKQWGEWVAEVQSPEDAVLPSEGRYPWATMHPEDGLTGDMTAVWKLGKKAAGRLLDGVQHDGMPA